MKDVSIKLKLKGNETKIVYAPIISEPSGIVRMFDYLYGDSKQWALNESIKMVKEGYCVMRGVESTKASVIEYRLREHGYDVVGISPFIKVNKKK